MLKTKEKPGSHTTRQGLHNKQNNTKIISQGSLEKKMIPLKSQVTNPKETNKKEFKKPLTSFTDENGNGKTFKSEDFPEGCNYGLRTGKLTGNTYLIAIDFDGSDYLDDFKQLLEAHNLPTDTVIVKSGGEHNGFHFYYLTDDTLNKNEKETYFKNVHVEFIEHENSFMVIPPSTVEKPYTIHSNGVKCENSKEFLTFMQKTIKPAKFKNILWLINTLKKEKSQETKSKETGNRNREYILPVLNNSFESDNCFVSTDCKGLEESEYYDLSQDTSLFSQLINYQSMKMYGKKQKIEVGKPFFCPLHKENNPSVALLKLKSGGLVLKEFHSRGKTIEYEKVQSTDKCQDTIDILEFAHAIKTGKIEYIASPKNKESFAKAKSKAFKELIELIEELNIQTGIGKAYRKEANELIKKLDKSYTENNIPELFKNALIVLKKYIIPKAVQTFNLGHYTFIAPIRKIHKATNLNLYESNKGIAVLLGLGIIERVTERATKKGKSFNYSLNLEVEIHDIDKILSKLIESGITELKHFSQHNQALWRILGKERMQKIFTRADERKNRKGGGENVPGKVEEQSPNVNFEGKRKEQNSNNRDTYEGDKGTNRNVPESESNSTGVHGGTRTDRGFRKVSGKPKSSKVKPNNLKKCYLKKDFTKRHYITWL